MVDAATALSGVRVIDLTSMIAGPILGRMFGELGADVIHVEPPHGDDGRNSTTPFLEREGILFSMHNRSKRGIVVDIKRPEGREVLLRLIRDADVFVENMTVGTLERQGLGYADMRAINPRLVYVSISGWGSKGPMAPLPGYDVLIQAYAGAVRRPTPELPPMLSPSLVGDPVAPLIAAFATLVALRQRDATGEGSHVTTSLLQAALHLKATGSMVVEDDPGDSRGERPAGTGGLAVLEARDGRWVVLCAWTDEHYRRLCGLAGFEHGLDPIYQTRLGRMEHHAALNEVFAAWVAQHPRSELLTLLQEHGIPVAPVNDNERELMHDPHLLANEMAIAIRHPTKGRFWQFGVPFELDGERGRVFAAPLLGQDTDDVLREAGYGAQEIEELRRSKAVT